VDNFWKTIIRQQLGAALDMLENAMRACPEELWSDPGKPPAWASRNVVGFWYVAYHTFFFLDYYLSDPSEKFAPPDPFTLDELDPAGILPDRPYTKNELGNYLDHCHKKAWTAIATLTKESARERRKFGPLEGSIAESLLSQMRHIQHHTGQLNLLLRQSVDEALPWVAKTGFC
jgi:hypothetical protein